MNTNGRIGVALLLAVALSACKRAEQESAATTPKASVPPNATASAVPKSETATATMPNAATSAKVSTENLEMIVDLQGRVSNMGYVAKEIHPEKEWRLGFAMTGDQKAQIVIHNTIPPTEKGATAWSPGEPFSKTGEEQLAHWLASATEVLTAEGVLPQRSKFHPAGKYYVVFQLDRVGLGSEPYNLTHMPGVFIVGYELVVKQKQ